MLRTEISLLHIRRKTVVNNLSLVNNAGAASNFKKGNELEIKEPDYGIGDKVVHIKFGVGTVKNIVKGPRDYQITVDFNGAGTKIMYAAFAKLKKL